MSAPGVLTRYFGKETKTVYSGNTLNRLSFLREDTAFLNRALHSPDARFLTFQNFNPLLRDDVRLEWHALNSVAKLIGDPYKETMEERIKKWNPDRDASGASFAQIVFLGIDETVKQGDSGHPEYPGAPRFAVDVNVYEQALPSLRTELEQFGEQITNDEHLAYKPVLFGVELEDAAEYSVIAEAKIILDWINRNRFCAGCGRRNMSVWGGFKLLCPTSYTGETKCPTKGQLTNISFPRTDTCIIAAVVSHDGSKVLIARGRRFRGKMYSCLAGFLEGGESLEDCVRREVFEESGVKVGRVLLYASQPWPYPANLMVGCIAEVADAEESSHKIHLEHDKELLDAKWVSRQDLRKLCDNESELDFVVPPKSSIAWVLLDAVAKDEFYTPTN